MQINTFIHSKRWIEGPSFLWRTDDYQMSPIEESIIPSDDPEVKQDIKVNAVILQDKQNATSQFISYFSDWKRLKVAIAWILKLKKLLRKLCLKRKELLTTNGTALGTSKSSMDAQMNMFKTTLDKQSLSLENLLEAEMAIVCFSQQQKFQEEIEALKCGSSGVRKGSSLYRLDPVLDNDILRVGGRLRKAAMPVQTKHPIILHKDQHISRLLLRHIHEQLGHCGRNHMLSKLRQNYWITNANAAARKVISKCVVCKRFRGMASEQKMADLPLERITPDHPPFTNVGVDYFGPIEVKRGRTNVKRYGVIFTCMASRAVHLEVAYSLDTDGCINALRRFISRRGQVVHIRSDNGTNFIGANRELKEAISAWNIHRIERELLQAGVQWNFNPPSGSHFGGAWERIIRMVRNILCSVLRQQTLDDESFHTILCEVESILNDRPITKLSDDPNDLEALTPNHLLLMKGKPALPPGLFEKADMYVKRRWKQVQYIADLFWKRWLREYLPLLQGRQKWTKERPSLKPGDIVLLLDQAAPRGSWPLGRVLETFPDEKGLVRTVKIKTKSSVLERPIRKLCLLLDSND